MVSLFFPGTNGSIQFVPKLLPRLGNSLIFGDICILSFSLRVGDMKGGEHEGLQACVAATAGVSHTCLRQLRVRCLQAGPLWWVHHNYGSLGCLLSAGPTLPPPGHSKSTGLKVRLATTPQPFIPSGGVRRKEGKEAKSCWSWPHLLEKPH